MMKFTLIAFFFSLLVITAFSKTIPVKEINPLPLKLTEDGPDKLTLHVAWNPIGEPDNGIIYYKNYKDHIVIVYLFEK